MDHMAGPRYLDKLRAWNGIEPFTEILTMNLAAFLPPHQEHGTLNAA